MDFTQTWHWPQWAFATLMFTGFLIEAGRHGKPKIESVGEEKGQPEKYNAFIALARLVLWSFILICGGYFS